MELNMNIFYLDADPIVAAQMMLDKHVVKMIVETAQLLSTAHRVLDGFEKVENKYINGSFPVRYRKVKRWCLSDDRDNKLYQSTHVNHPSAIWCRQSSANYLWLYRHFVGLLIEYTYRYGKTHKCQSMMTDLSRLPDNIDKGTFSQPPAAMDLSFVLSDDSIENYRNYYKHGKTHLLKYTKRDAPEWLLA